MSRARASEGGLRLERPWPFRLEEIAADVSFHHRKDAAVVPPQHAKGLTEKIPGARLRLYPGEGHISILDRPIREIAENLIVP